MAGVVRLSRGRIAQKLFCSFVSQTTVRNIKLKQRICFHTSSYLNVLGQEIKMPSLSPTMTEGTIVNWLKKEGDTITPGDVLCEIQTDKAVMSFETEEEGILAKILVNQYFPLSTHKSVKSYILPNTSVSSILKPVKFSYKHHPSYDFSDILVDSGTKDIKVGSLIALMVAEGEDWKAVEIPGIASPPGIPGKGGSAPSSVGGNSSSSYSGGGSVATQEIKMPSLSPTMDEGTIVSWKKKEGEKLNPGDALCDIQTDKAVITFEVEEEAILAKILVKEGSTNIKVGAPIALTVEVGADWTKAVLPGAPTLPAPTLPAPKPTVPVSPPPVSGSLPGLEVKMPSLSPTMSEGTIVAWKKKEGDKINPGDALCEIQTDKAIMTFEVEEEGVLAKILVPQGTTNIQVGTLIALIVEPDANWKDVRIPGAEVPVADVPVADHSARVAVASPSFVTGSVPGQEINMPSLSPTMSEGTIISWKKNEGDKINPGDALCEIQTDKAIMTFEVEEEGILAKILVPAGTANVKVGTLIALMVEEGTDWQDVKIPGDVSIAAKPVSVSAPAPTFTTGSVPGLEVKMPSLSPTMSEGVIVSWVKKEGEKINPGDVLCEIQTDKAVMSFETEEEGVLAKILAPANSGPVKVGSLIAMIVDEGKDWKDVAIPVIGAPAAAPTAAPAPAPAVPKPQPVPSGFHVVGDFAPAVRTLLERYHLTGKEVTPTGRNKRLLKGDVLKYVADNKLSPKPPEPVPLPVKKAPAAKPPTPVSKPPEPGRKVGTNYTDIEVSSMRRTIANRLTQSKTEIPHAYSTLEAQIDGLLSARKQLQNLGVKVSVNDFVVKAVASALKQCPFINVLYAQDQIKPSSTIDISIAVATPNGLITPIVKSADKKSIDEISLEIQKLAEKARLGKLQLNEFQGGSFTISNLGMFGIREFSAIINPPQCAILAVGGGQLTIKPDGSKATMMSATLSYDARAMMEDEVALFMEILEGYLENPASLLLTGATIKVKSKATYEL